VGGVEAEALAHAEDGGAVTPDRAGEQDRVAGCRGGDCGRGGGQAAADILAEPTEVDRAHQQSVLVLDLDLLARNSQAHADHHPSLARAAATTAWP
jgi:hypothetical protein